MTLEADIVQWIGTRPEWQQHILARLCAGESISDEEVTKIAQDLISSSTFKVVKLNASDIPGGATTAKPVQLCKLHDVAGINALAADQSLTFSRDGLTIVYGDNGSGKSGYARLLRRAVRARVHGDVLGNVFEAGNHSNQHAIIEYAVGDSKQVDEWKWQEAFSQELAQVQFYDVDCGDAYISTASEISYRPSALVILDQLVQVCDAVRAVLDEKLQENANTKPPLPSVEPDTQAGKFMASLNSATTREQIGSATLIQDNDRRLLADALREEAHLKGSDPVKERQRLNTLSADFAVLATHIEDVFRGLSTTGLENLNRIRTKALDLRAAAKIASSENFADESLPGVGLGAWRQLWQSAKGYSETVAYVEHDFPHTQDGRCVLCQQTLDSAASERLQRFQRFMTDSTEKDARDAEKGLQSARDEIAGIQATPASVTAALGNARSTHGAQANEVDSWIQASAATAREFVEWIDNRTKETPNAVAECPASELRRIAADLTEQAKSIDPGTFQEKLWSATKQVEERQSKISLAAGVENITKEVNRLSARASIEAARRSTDTGAITRKSSELTKEHVTRLVRDRFTRETERLRLRRVTLDPKSGKKSSLHHLPALLNATSKASVTEVLSEGEKTALGLAGFFTEIEFDETQSAIVLDDPVTSLDHARRSIVASRIAELASDRQVVVFSHDISFVGDLVKHASELDIPVTRRWVSFRNDQTGFCFEGHPWTAKEVATRINELEVEVSKIEKDRRSLEPEAYDERCASWAGKLSETWERAVNLEVIYQVVDRGTAEVKPRMFKILAAITDEDNDQFQRGYGKTSQWARRHDKDPETNYTPPSPDEMKNEIANLKSWFERIKKYRK